MWDGTAAFNSAITVSKREWQTENLTSEDEGYSMISVKEFYVSQKCRVHVANTVVNQT